MRLVQRGVRCAVAGLLLGMVGVAGAQGDVVVPPHKAAVVLFDGRGLGSFNTFIRGRGLNADPEHVFQVEDGTIHVSGHEMGYLVTKQSFHRFYLKAEFKWVWGRSASGGAGKG